MERKDILELAVEIAFSMEECGAEIYRVEETVNRIFKAYGVESGQIFAIPNCLIVSVEDENGEPVTRMRRLPQHGTDVDRFEKISNYCRRLCAAPRDPKEELAGLRELEATQAVFSFPVQMLGHFIGGSAFTLFWGGKMMDALAGGLCALAIGLCQRMLDNVKANLFVRTMIAACVSAFLAIVLVHFGVGRGISYITIGALMLLVPGVLFTNSMRDVMAGDTIAGLLRTVESLMIALAIAMGTFVAMTLGGLLRL